ncbi:SLBB domain-containing protein [Pseudogulbenkiania subflava]|uniref:Protein involved in polysaccharide export, contains SLBB domain of the beta-grasp fold n=1 Tax=Pseudogulbenkiania subflava DSM 22618 TaxID=1123014 RepID=A0A1Y6BH27_9NEIS|nr:SLBB domain-containing protein [Pseudogulbenkiania subflava]SMF10768.1 protein involved in polysaccharide export, contains SLBB domain of the beta-grasp fold [Pseudogulbenkiania subflava DSM 22618]
MHKTPTNPALRTLCHALSIAFLSSSAIAATMPANAAAMLASNPMLAPGYDVSAVSGLPSIGNANPVEANVVKPTTQRPVGRAEAPSQNSEFSNYVKNVTGAELPLFGQSLFQGVPTTFAPLEAGQVNPDYLIGPGDELQVRGWGMVDIDLTVTVDRNGSIYLPRVGSVNVAGVKYRDLQGHLKKAVNRIFTNFELTASISQTRAVQIYVVGHATRPGTYTLSAMSTLLNALFTSGGPSGTGTMRDIQVKRGSETITHFDLYDMLVKGDKSRDIALQDGDVIFIPEVGPLVALTGDVKKPAIYELKGQTTLADVVNWSGGLDSAAAPKPVIIEKNVDNRYQTVVEIGADKKDTQSRLAALPLSSSDILRVFAPASVAVVAQKEREFVRVGGAVQQTGVFQIQKGETLRELISRLGGVREDGYLFATQLNRETVRRAQQDKLDEVADRYENEVEKTASDRIAGLSNKENIDALTAEVARQRRIAQRMRTVKATGRIVLELPDGSAELKNLPDMPLQDGDSIFVPRKPGTVDVLGAVYQQNTFIYKPRRSVSDYLGLAGGATITGDKDEMYVIRADGTVHSRRSSGWLVGLGSERMNPGDAIVVPEKIERTSFTQELKEWTSILYQFGLGAAGLKVLKD